MCICVYVKLKSNLRKIKLLLLLLLIVYQKGVAIYPRLLKTKQRFNDVCFAIHPKTKLLVFQ